MLSLQRATGNRNTVGLLIARQHAPAAAPPGAVVQTPGGLAVRAAIQEATTPEALAAIIAELRSAASKAPPDRTVPVPVLIGGPRQIASYEAPLLLAEAEHAAGVARVPDLPPGIDPAAVGEPFAVYSSAFATASGRLAGRVSNTCLRRRPFARVDRIEHAAPILRHDDSNHRRRGSRRLVTGAAVWGEGFGTAQITGSGGAGRGKSWPAAAKLLYLRRPADWLGQESARSWAAGRADRLARQRRCREQQ